MVKAKAQLIIFIANIIPTEKPKPLTDKGQKGKTKDKRKKKYFLNK